LNPLIIIQETHAAYPVVFARSSQLTYLSAAGTLQRSCLIMVWPFYKWEIGGRMLSFANKTETMDRATTLSKLIIGQIFAAHKNSTILNSKPRLTAFKNLTFATYCTDPNHAAPPSVGSITNAPSCAAKLETVAVVGPDVLRRACPMASCRASSAQSGTVQPSRPGRISLPPTS
jgi:hypothetical protein